MSTLRPRLVVTNASDYELEVQEPDGSLLLLPPKQSQACHWRVSEKDKAFHMLFFLLVYYD